MKDIEQARDFIEANLSGLEKSVIEKDEPAIQKNKQEFSTLISEYGNVLGTKNVNIYTQNYTNIINNGGYLK